jgi:hypothetical protein
MYSIWQATRNKDWQKYAAAIAASFTKLFLEEWLSLNITEGQDKHGVDPSQLPVCYLRYSERIFDISPCRGVRRAKCLVSRSHRQKPESD